jgi:hypothetical protein
LSSWYSLNVSIHHAIILKWSLIRGTVFKGENTVPILEIVSPHAFVLAAIRIVESTLAVSESKAPISNVTIAKQLVVTVGPLEPDVSTEATLVVILPVSSVLLI